MSALLNDERLFRLRKKQLLNHFFNRLTIDPEQMSDIGNAAQEICNAAFSEKVLNIETKQIGDNGKTIKTLFSLSDGEKIESVLMDYDNRSTLCISSQVGCAMACPFCATGTLGLKRNLTSNEIIWQVFMAKKEAKERAFAPLTNIVFMGMGEPTQNLEAVFNALDYICIDNQNNNQTHQRNAYNFAINEKNITISTVGDVLGIERMIASPRNFRLAISLHAPNNTLRNVLVPLNKKYNVEAVLLASYKYFLIKKRRISIEYALMKDINDTEKCAFELAKIINRQSENSLKMSDISTWGSKTPSQWAHVNLIPLNEVNGSKWTTSSKCSTSRFIEILKSKNIMVTLRDSRGNDIDAACGQLALNGVKTD